MFHFSSQRNKEFPTKCWKIIFEVPNVVTTVWTERENVVFLMGEVKDCFTIIFRQLDDKSHMSELRSSEYFTGLTQSLGLG